MKWCRRYIAVPLFSSCAIKVYVTFLRSWWLDTEDLEMLILAMQELELLDDDANVFKLIGPVLVKQDLAEAKANVNKRLEYITAEL